MPDRTKIEWCDATLNPFPGCSEVQLQDGSTSPACAHCYASRAAARMASNPKIPRYQGLAVFQPGGQPQWTGQIGLVPTELDKLVGWTRPRRIFIESMGDVAHENLPVGRWILLWNAMVQAVVHQKVPHWIYLLTKRPGNLARLLEKAYWLSGPAVYWSVMDRVVVMTTIENQPIADNENRLLGLGQCLAVHFGVSAEPLVGPLDLRLQGKHAFVKWVICGGMSGPHAVPMHPKWARDLRDQCHQAGARFFFKQWGEWAFLGPVPGEYPTGAVKEGVSLRSLAMLEPSGEIHQVSNCLGVNHCLYQPAPGSVWMVRAGTANAGRLLDGRTWSQHPGVDEAPWKDRDEGVVGHA